MKFSLILFFRFGFVNVKKSLSFLPKKRSKEGCFSLVHTLEIPSRFQISLPAFIDGRLRHICRVKTQRLVFL